MKLTVAVLLLSTLGWSQAKPLVPMPGKGHKRVVAAVAGAVAAGVVTAVVLNGSQGRAVAHVKGGPVSPNGPRN